MGQAEFYPLTGRIQMDIFIIIAFLFLYDITILVQVLNHLGYGPLGPDPFFCQFRNRDSRMFLYIRHDMYTQHIDLFTCTVIPGRIGIVIIYFHKLIYLVGMLCHFMKKFFRQCWVNIARLILVLHYIT